MQLLKSIFAVTLLATSLLEVSALAPRSALNGPCTGSGGAPGVCISTSSCSKGGGKYITGACPGTPDDIKCCVKPACGSGGNCRWTSQCSGTTVSNLCPGPANFKCCEGKSTPTKGNLPGLNSVQSGHARTIIARAKADFSSSLQKRACEVAIATAMQESSIRILANSGVPSSYNYPHDGVGHDHDSVGIFQQRASWGTVKDRMAAASSADKFFAALKKVKGWNTMAIGTAAQKVQVSACPTCYSKWVTLATNVCNAGW